MGDSSGLAAGDASGLWAATTCAKLARPTISPRFAAALMRMLLLADGFQAAAAAITAPLFATKSALRSSPGELELLAAVSAVQANGSAHPVTLDESHPGCLKLLRMQEPNVSPIDSHLIPNRASRIAKVDKAHGKLLSCWPLLPR